MSHTRKKKHSHNKKKQISQSKENRQSRSREKKSERNKDKDKKYKKRLISGSSNRTKNRSESYDKSSSESTSSRSSSSSSSSSTSSISSTSSSNSNGSIVSRNKRHSKNEEKRKKRENAHKCSEKKKKKRNRSISKNKKEKCHKCKNRSRKRKKRCNSKDNRKMNVDVGDNKDADISDKKATKLLKSAKKTKKRKNSTKENIEHERKNISAEEDKLGTSLINNQSEPVQPNNSTTLNKNEKNDIEQDLAESVNLKKSDSNLEIKTIDTKLNVEVKLENESKISNEIKLCDKVKNILATPDLKKKSRKLDEAQEVTKKDESLEKVYSGDNIDSCPLGEESSLMIENNSVSFSDLGQLSCSEAPRNIVSVRKDLFTEGSGDASYQNSNSLHDSKESERIPKAVNVKSSKKKKSKKHKTKEDIVNSKTLVRVDAIVNTSIQTSETTKGEKSAVEQGIISNTIMGNNEVCSAKQPNETECISKSPSRFNNISGIHVNTFSNEIQTSEVDLKSHRSQKEENLDSCKLIPNERNFQFEEGNVTVKGSAKDLKESGNSRKEGCKGEKDYVGSKFACDIDEAEKNGHSVINEIISAPKVSHSSKILSITHQMPSPKLTESGSHSNEISLKGAGDKSDITPAKSQLIDFSKKHSSPPAEFELALEQCKVEISLPTSVKTKADQIILKPLEPVEGNSGSQLDQCLDSKIKWESVSSSADICRENTNNSDSVQESQISSTIKHTSHERSLSRSRSRSASYISETNVKQVAKDCDDGLKRESRSSSIHKFGKNNTLQESSRSEKRSRTRSSSRNRDKKRIKPSSRSRSKSKSRRKSGSENKRKSRSKSQSQHRSSSTSKQNERSEQTSPAMNQRNERSRSQSMFRSGSPTKCRSKSSSRYRSVSKIRQTSISRDGQKSRSGSRIRTKSCSRSRSQSEVSHKDRETKRRSESKRKHRSRSRSRLRKSKHRSRSHSNHRSGSNSKGRGIKVSRCRSTSHTKHSSRTHTTGRSRSQSKHRTSRHRTRSRSKHRFRSRSKCKSRSHSKHRSRSQSRPRSTSRRKLRSTSLNRHRSKSRRRSTSRSRRRSTSRSRRKSNSRSRHRSTSRGRRRSISRGRRRSSSRTRRRSTSHRRRSTSRSRRRSTSRSRRRSTSRSRRRSTSRSRRRSNSRSRRRSTSRSRRRSTSRSRRRSTTQSRRRSKSYSRRRSVSQRRHRSRSRRKSTSRNRHNSTSQSRRKSTSRNRFKSSSRGRNRSRSQSKHRSRSPSKHNSLYQNSCRSSSRSRHKKGDSKHRSCSPNKKLEHASKRKTSLPKESKREHSISPSCTISKSIGKVNNNSDGEICNKSYLDVSKCTEAITVPENTVKCHVETVCNSVNRTVTVSLEDEVGKENLSYGLVHSSKTGMSLNPEIKEQEMEKCITCQHKNMCNCSNMKQILDDSHSNEKTQESGGVNTISVSNENHQVSLPETEVVSALESVKAEVCFLSENNGLEVIPDLQKTHNTDNLATELKVDEISIFPLGGNLNKEIKNTVSDDLKKVSHNLNIVAVKMEDDEKQTEHSPSIEPYSEAGLSNLYDSSLLGFVDLNKKSVNNEPKNPLANINDSMELEIDNNELQKAEQSETITFHQIENKMCSENIIREHKGADVQIRTIVSLTCDTEQTKSSSDRGLENAAVHHSSTNESFNLEAQLCLRPVKENNSENKHTSSVIHSDQTECKITIYNSEIVTNCNSESIGLNAEDPIPTVDVKQDNCTFFKDEGLCKESIEQKCENQDICGTKFKKSTIKDPKSVKEKKKSKHRSRSHSKERKSKKRRAKSYSKEPSLIRHRSRSISKDRKKMSREKKVERSKSKKKKNDNKEKESNEMKEYKTAESNQDNIKSRSVRSRSQSKEKSQRKSPEKTSKDSKNKEDSKTQTSEKSVKLRSKSRSKSRSKERKSGSRNSKERNRSRSKENKKRKARSRSTEERKRRRRRRSRSHPASQEKIDKKKLLEIAQRNAMAMMKQEVVMSSVISKGKLIVIEKSGKSVAELTDFCKKLSEKEAKSQQHSSQSDDSLSDSDSDLERPYHHPFQLKQQPLPGFPSGKTGQKDKQLTEPPKLLAIQYPTVLKKAGAVSQESQQSQCQIIKSDWVPVSPQVPDTPAPNVPEIKRIVDTPKEEINIVGTEKVKFGQPIKIVPKSGNEVTLSEPETIQRDVNFRWLKSTNKRIQ